MSKSSRKKKIERKLASKLGNYNSHNGKSPYSNFQFTKPGSGK